jgi:acetoin utilization protein AcuC
MGRAAFVYEDALSRHILRPDHPMQPVRLRHTYELLQAYGAFDGHTSLLVPSRPAVEEELRWLHAPEYIAAVRTFSSDSVASPMQSDLGLSGYNPRRFKFDPHGDNPIYPGMYDAAALSTGASLVAAELVADRQVDVAFNISGGLHHAAPDHASGFCVFNDPAIAIKYLLSRGLRVAYVDIDAHHGDGVQQAFYDDNQVLTISLHESGQFLFPGTGFASEVGVGPGLGYSVNLPLYPYTDDEIYLWAFGEIVPPLVRAFAPDVLVTQLGIDSYHSDPLTHLQLTTRGYVAAVQKFARLGVPWLALGGGGYDLTAVARCWAMAYGVMLGVEWPDQIPASWAQQHGVQRLGDILQPRIPPQVRQDARRFAEESVAAIKGELFPRHHLEG